MPSKSKAQHNLMAMVANDPAAAKRMGISRSVGEEFMKADKGRKFAGGGEMESKKMVGKEIAFMKKKGAPKSMVKHEESEMKGMKKFASGGLAAGHKAADGVAKKGKTRGMQVKMAKGGKAMGGKC